MTVTITTTNDGTNAYCERCSKPGRRGGAVRFSSTSGPNVVAWIRRHRSHGKLVQR